MVAPMSTSATTPSMDTGSSLATRAPPSSSADWRSSTFSERDAASSTCTISGLFGIAPITSKSSSIWASMSFSSSSAGIGITLVITADPATAAAASLALLPERFIARRMASPTASTSTMFFSTTAFGGSGSTA
ncbi:hypothetical protein G6F63_015120 [Rhizopus arrhizus]|nr:hypothetical protein G6F63_015120 [Rhizopus arrhizus]